MILLICCFCGCINREHLPNEVVANAYAQMLYYCFSFVPMCVIKTVVMKKKTQYSHVVAIILFDIDDYRKIIC